MTIFKIITHKIFKLNTYLLVDEKNKQVVLIDPGQYIETALALIEEFDYNIAFIIITHSHIDHCCGMPKVLSKWDVNYYIGEGDQLLWNGMKHIIGLPNDIKHAKYVADNETLNFNMYTINISSIGEHTKGSIAITVEDIAFIGDMQNYEKFNIGMQQKNKHYSLIFPGHGSVIQMNGYSRLIWNKIPSNNNLIEQFEKN